MLQLFVVVSQRWDQYALEEDMLVIEVCVYTCGFCHLSYMLSVDQVPVPFAKELVTSGRNSLKFSHSEKL